MVEPVQSVGRAENIPTIPPELNSLGKKYKILFIWQDGNWQVGDETCIARQQISHTLTIWLGFNKWD